MATTQEVAEPWRWSDGTRQMAPKLASVAEVFFLVEVGPWHTGAMPPKTLGSGVEAQMDAANQNPNKPRWQGALTPLSGSRNPAGFPLPLKPGDRACRSGITWGACQNGTLDVVRRTKRRWSPR